MKPATTSYCQRIDITCDDCGVNCTGNGVCMNGTCSCSNEWDGKYCDRPKACQGSAVGYLQDQKIGCCPYSAVDVEQRCCLNVSAVLDVDGKCCESGILDSCGICDGLAISVDVQNECCATVRDEKGICCQSGLLDGCHVCDGDDVSCATNATITTLMNNTLGMPHNASHDWTMFISYFISTVASKLGIDTQSMILNAVQVEDVVNGNCENDPDPANGCLIAPTSKLIGIFNFIILPVPSATLQGMHIKKEALISTLLRMNDTDEIATGAKIISVSNVQRVGVCGNGVCEKGERCNPRGKSDTSNSRPCCLKDCPYVISSCPSPQNGSKATVACSGNGICLDTSGQCDCFKGYTGSDCLHCTVGWTEIGNGICIQIANTSHTLKFSTTYGQNPYLAIPPAGQLPHSNLITTHILKTGVLAAIIASAVIIGLVCLGLAVCAFKLRDRPNSDESGSQATIQPDEVNRTEEDRDSHMEPVTVTWTQTFKEEQAAAKNSLLLQPKIVSYAPTKTSILMESTSPITPTEEGTVSKWRKSLVSPWRGGGLSEWKKVLLPKQMQQPYELVGIVSSSSSSSAANFDPHEHPQQAPQTQGY
ncbi:hypothetical protein O6H91_06G040900 [Diphasiastrum complanatum]|nr:hypothetical protein O6H91_06G040900 [Diphasiastrum complanatum]